MKKLLCVIFMSMMVGTAFSDVMDYDTSNLSFWLPEGWETAFDETGFVAMPTDGNLYIIIKPYNEITNEEELLTAIENTFDGLFSEYSVNEEYDGYVNDMYVWYAFFSSVMQGQDMGGMYALLSTGDGPALFMSFGDVDSIDTYGDDIDMIFNSLIPINTYE